MVKPEAYSSVVLLHTPDKVIVHERPIIPGKLAYGGKWQFLGGGRDMHNGTLEPADDAAVRELDEESNLGKVDPRLLEEQWGRLVSGPR